MGSNVREGVVFRNPRSEGERFQVVSRAADPAAAVVAVTRQAR
jgi:hypothetical protein